MESFGKHLQSGIYSFQSKLLAKEIPYYAVLPDRYYESAAEFSIVYLLHGLFGRFDNWITNTDLLKYAAEFPFIIICAEGENSWYSDSSAIKNHFFESYLTDELIPSVEKRFNVRAEKKSRMIAGLSMGGYGAFKLACRRPDLFCCAASTSGAFHAAGIFRDDIWVELHDSIYAVFTNDAVIRTKNDLFQIIEKFPAEQFDELPFFYFDCGAEDSFLPINFTLAKAFERRRIIHEFKVYPGGHDWKYWNSRLLNILRIAGKFLR